MSGPSHNPSPYALAQLRAELAAARRETDTLKVSLERQVETVLNWQEQAAAARRETDTLRPPHPDSVPQWGTDDWRKWARDALAASAGEGTS